MDNETNKDGAPFRYFVAGLRIGNTDYTVKAVVTEKNGNQYYDHKLSKIEKGRLIDILTALSSTEDASLPSARDKVISQLDDKRLVQILQQEESSKIVDENGEPLVVYHGTTHNDIDVFRVGEGAYYGGGIYFQGKEGAEKWAGKTKASLEEEKERVRRGYENNMALSLCADKFISDEYFKKAFAKELEKDKVVW